MIEIRIEIAHHRHCVGAVMSEIIQFKTRSGSQIAVEVDPQEAEGAQRVSRGGRAVAEAAASLEDALSSVRPVVESMIEDLKDLTSPPSSVALEFGIKLSASLDAIIAKGTGEGNIKVTLTWNKA